MTSPVFGFLAATSGSLEGAIIRDMRLANELHRRGYAVVVYWMIQQNARLVDPGIPQRVLCRAMRYVRKRPTILGELAGALFDLAPAERRIALLQTRPHIAHRLARNLTNVVCDGGDGDPRLVRRLERFMRRDGVTHLMPTFAFACPFALAVKRRRRHAFDYVVTFQAEELFVGYAAELGRREEYFAQLREAVAHSPWRAVAVSADYVHRLHEEMGVDPARLVAISPGVDAKSPRRSADDRALVHAAFPRLNFDLPLVTFVGRNDAEKGVDLVLYAARILRQLGRRFELVVAGGTTFGEGYRRACEQIAGHLRLDVHWYPSIAPPLRDALYAHSRCVVYPSIHREPFGMVPVEAISQGIPVVVPDQGGLPEAIRAADVMAGLVFRVWDSGHLANQIERLLVDDELHARLSANTARVAAYHSIARMADRVLAHLEIDTPGTAAEPYRAAG